jgi:SAM-dependent methyltransferase
VNRLGQVSEEGSSPGNADQARRWSAAFATASPEGMQAYEDALVGAVFTPWGEHLLDALDLTPGEHLLDVATGPGTVARLASARLGPGGHVLATDLSDAMLALAEAKAGVPGGAQIEYRRSPAVPLDAPEAAFDVACCQQGLQFFPDRLGALEEMRRALRTGGRLGLAVWSGIEQCPPFAAVRDAIHEVLGLEPAQRYAEGPWGLNDAAVLTELVTRAGFTQISANETERPVRFGAVGQLDHSLAASGLAAEITSLPGNERTELSSAIAENLRGLTDTSGAVVSFLTSRILVAVAP